MGPGSYNFVLGMYIHIQMGWDVGWAAKENTAFVWRNTGDYQVGSQLVYLGLWPAKGVDEGKPSDSRVSLCCEYHGCSAPPYAQM